MTEAVEQGAGEPHGEGAASRGARKAARRLARLSAFSGANLLSTFRHIAHRRLWRPAIYPRLPWLEWVIYGAAAILVVALVLDEPVGNFRRQWPGWLIILAENVTRAGLSGWYLVPAAIVGIYVNLMDWPQLKGRRLLRAYNWTGLSLFVLTAAGLSGLLVTFLKHAIGRARPVHFGEIGAYAFDPFSGESSFASFPSGHATTMGAIVMILVLLLPMTRFLVVPLGLALAMTRVVLSSHYPSDVLAGLLLGAGFTLATAVVFARLGYVFQPNGNGLPRRRKSFGVFW